MSMESDIGRMREEFSAQLAKERKGRKKLQAHLESEHNAKLQMEKDLEEHKAICRRLEEKLGIVNGKESDRVSLSLCVSFSFLIIIALRKQIGS